jgi:hypothetical protein
MSYLVVQLSVRDITRIFDKVIVDRVSGCWNWIGAVSDGYGNVRYGGRIERSHRVVYAWVHGPIPRQPKRTGPRVHVPQLDHVVCQNRRCCNPVHLELVTQKVNILRGNGVCARYARMTRCSKGHPLPLKPNMKCGSGNMARRCVPCVKEQQRKNYLRRRDSGYYK